MVCGVGKHALLVGLFLSTIALPSAVIAQEPAKTSSQGTLQDPGQAVFAKVNGKIITQAEFHSAFATFLRQKFYHGQIPTEQLQAARKEVLDQLVSRILNFEEIARRDVKPDAEDVERRIQSYEQRYANSPTWQKSREAMLPGLREQLSQQSQLTRLEQLVKAIAAPTREEAIAFYQGKPNLFTEPEKLRLHTILLAVDPSSPRPAWDAALREGEAIVQRLRSGASFAEQARLFSRDPSADSGGDLGYLHMGMLPESLQSKIDKYKLGEVADPIEMLQGVGIFRLDERIPAKLQPFETVAVRASELLLRERQEKAWSDLQAKLRAEAKIELAEDPVKGPEPSTGK